MKTRTDFTNNFELTMSVASSLLKGKDFFRYRSDLIDAYASKCVNDPNGTYYTQQVDGIYPLILEYGSEERANQFCLSLLFKDRINNSKIYQDEIRDRGVNRLRKHVSTTSKLSSQIRRAKKKMEQEDDMYKDAIKLRHKASSLYMQEVFDEVVEEKEMELNSIKRELGEYNMAINRLLFGKETLNPEEEVRFIKFVTTYCPDKTMKK